jgi:hypothetical protein
MDEFRTQRNKNKTENKRLIGMSSSTTERKRSYFVTHIHKTHTQMQCAFSYLIHLRRKTQTHMRDTITKKEHKTVNIHERWENKV